MQMKTLGTGIGTALAIGFSVALAMQGNVSAGQNPPAAAAARAAAAAAVAASTSRRS